MNLAVFPSSYDSASSRAHAPHAGAALKSIRIGRCCWFASASAWSMSLLQLTAIVISSDFSVSGYMLVCVEILAGHIVFRHFARLHLGDVGRFGALDTFDRIRFEGISLFGQFLDAFRISIGKVGYLLSVTRLPGRGRSRFIAFAVLLGCHNFAPAYRD